MGHWNVFLLIWIKQFLFYWCLGKFHLHSVIVVHFSKFWLTLHFWKLYWNKNWVKFLFSHFFVVPQKVLWRPSRPLTLTKSFMKAFNFFTLSGIGLLRVNLFIHCFDWIHVIWKFYLICKLMNQAIFNCKVAIIDINKKQQWS